jgi:hypothetical protein
MSAARAITGQAEIQDTLACLYSMRGSRVYTSHQFATVYLTQTLAILNAEEYKVPIIRIGASRFTGATQYMDYMFRPEALEALSYFEFVRRYERVSHSKSKKREAGDEDAAAAAEAMDLRTSTKPGGGAGGAAAKDDAADGDSDKEPEDDADDEGGEAAATMDAGGSAPSAAGTTHLASTSRRVGPPLIAACRVVAVYAGAPVDGHETVTAPPFAVSEHHLGGAVAGRRVFSHGGTPRRCGVRRGASRGAV